MLRQKSPGADVELSLLAVRREAELIEPLTRHGRLCASPVERPYG